VIASKGGSTPDDNKFVGAGTFVDYGDVLLERNFEDPTGIHKARHNFSPTELFIHRPDFVVNTPTILLKPSTTWKEVN